MTSTNIDDPRGPGRARIPPSRGRSSRGLVRAARRVASFVFSLAVTLFGLLLVTFLIARVVPLDPVLAVVGDRATQAQYDAARVELGLTGRSPSSSSATWATC